ncbi:cytochrome ubiquinol oxidase subunit I [Ideonella sp.]|uniref:cytochrome ubiquinol oxidase subunit I n=1 Tax=Ideonella sp. TaxID=1929293 RepID=UPI002B4A9B85|nr:cytochrome ubiquinol oxidase subunit I [Ideonella sp.]HJV71788.1 cytochrome ubiquinol oxidase subunit I [Ideonella sp.]
MNADALELALPRLEFGVTASFHYLFVPLTLGLALALCLMEAAHVRTGRSVWAEAADFWRRFFLLAWVVGMVTGYPLRWQLQSHWPGYSEAVHEVLAAVMALEAWIAPLMLSLVAVLSLAGSRLGPRTRLASSVLLLLAMATQAAGILTMNAWMQHPVGVAFTASGAQLVSLWDVFANPYAHTKIAHTLAASVVTGAFFMLAAAGGYLLRQRHLPVARVSMRLALPMGVVGLAATLYTGHDSALDVARFQPMKFAAMEAHWKADEDGAPLVVWGAPDLEAQANRWSLELPHAMGLLVGDASPPGVSDLLAGSKAQIRRALAPDAPAELAMWRTLYQQAARRHAAAWPGLSDEARLDLAARQSCPNVPVLFTAFRVMAGIGALLLVLLALAWRQRFTFEAGPDGRRVMVWLMAALPLPWLATLSGWLVAEAGRQPWVVYGQLLTAEAGVPAAAGGAAALAARLAALALLGGAFAFTAAWLWRRGPGPLPWPGFAALRPSLR